MAATPPEPTPPTPPPPPTPEPAKFTQAELDRIAAREKAEGRTAGERALLEGLGVKDLDELKSVLAAKKAADEAQLSEAQLATKKAEDRETAATAREAAANERTLNATKIMALAEAGVTPKRLSAAQRLMDLTEDDPAKAKEAAEKLKTEFPEFFAPETGEPPDPKKGVGSGYNPPRPSTAPPKKGANASGNDPRKAAREILERRHPKLAKKE